MSTHCTASARRTALFLVLLLVLAGVSCDNTALQRRIEEHVLTRIGYGPDAWSLTRLRQLGTVAYIEEQLQPQLLDDSALEAAIAARYPSLSMPLAQIKQIYSVYVPVPGVTRPRQELAEAKVLRAVRSKRQLEQVLTDFWFNHFNVDGANGWSRWAAVTYERDVIRPRVLGRFEDMLRGVAAHPAMLDYLDNASNFKDGYRRFTQTFGMNENFGREILELHTVGVDGGYVQADVENAARAFTGWTIRAVLDPSNDGFIYLDEGHDKSAKSIMGLSIPAGGGIDDGEALILYLARHPATAERLSRKLCQRFIGDAPPEALVQQAKQVWLATNGDLRAVTRTILTSSEFLNGPVRTKVKRPLVYVASLARALGVGDEVLFAAQARTQLTLMGEDLYGAAPPTGYPEDSTFFVEEGPFVTRINLAQRAVIGQWGFAPSFSGISGSPTQIVDGLQQRFIPAGIEPATRTALIQLAQSLGASSPVQHGAATMFASPEFQTH